MSLARTLSIALLTIALPTIGFGQSLSVEVKGGILTTNPKTDVNCAAGAEGFGIALEGLSTGLEASGEFALRSTDHLRVRRGGTLNDNDKHFRPAIKWLEGQRTVINITQGYIRNEGYENIEADANLAITGCRAGMDYSFVSGHLKLAGQAALYRIDLDDDLQNLMEADGGFDAVSFDFSPLLTRAPDNPLGNMMYSLQELAIKDVEDPLGFLTLKFSISRWQFPSMEPGSPPLNARINVTWSAVLAEQTEPVQDTN